MDEVRRLLAVRAAACDALERRAGWGPPSVMPAHVQLGAQVPDEYRWTFAEWQFAHVVLAPSSGIKGGLPAL